MPYSDVAGLAWRTSALSMLSGGRLLTLAWMAASMSASAPYLHLTHVRHSLVLLHFSPCCQQAKKERWFIL